jgi:hypothetical protein
MQEDNDHLRLLSIFHYIVGGISALVSLTPIIHIGLGILLVTQSGTFPPIVPAEFSSTEIPTPDAKPPAWVGWLFIVLGAGFITVGLTFSALLILTGRWLQQRRRHTFCVVMAAISCAFFPFGTALGVFSLIVLCRPSVKEQFHLTTA